MRSPETSLHRRRLLAHLREQLVVRLEAELRDEAERRGRAAAGPRGSSAARPCAGARASRSARPPSGSTSSPVVEPARHRVDGEVAAAHVVLDRERRVGDDLEVVPAGPGARPPCAAARTRSRRASASRMRLSRGWSRTPTSRSATTRSSTRPCGASARPQPFGVEPGHEEVRVLRVEPEQLVAHGAADEVGVEPERADVLLDLLAHPAILAGRRASSSRCSTVTSHASAIASISTSAPDGSFATSTVARAGGCSPTCCA